jgi:DNA-binding winged helix-turn-helix (wHTH) protein
MRYLFGTCALDVDSRRLFRDGSPVRLSPRGFKLLAMLLEQRSRALSKNGLLGALWPDTFVSETNLATLVTEIRSAIGDAKPWHYVRTLHGFGYSFDAPVRVEDERAQPKPRWKLVGAAGEFTIPDGEHVLGRGRDARIVVEGPLVSRRHALLVASGASLTIEDLGSKNGTTIGTEAVAGRRTLATGDVIWIGSHAFRVVDLESQDETLSAKEESPDHPDAQGGGPDGAPLKGGAETA